MNGRWVVFGLGNFISGMGGATKCCGAGAQDGAIVRVHGHPEPGWLLRRRPAGDRADPGLPCPLRHRAGHDGAQRPRRHHPVLRGGLQQSLARTQKVLGDYLVAGP